MELRHYKLVEYMACHAIALALLRIQVKQFQPTIIFRFPISGILTSCEKTNYK